MINLKPFLARFPPFETTSSEPSSNNCLDMDKFMQEAGTMHLRMLAKFRFYAYPDLMQILFNHKEGKTRKRRLANIDDEQRVLLDVNNNLLWSIH